MPPEKILCITFTKAAAANMAERVFSTLGHWITLDDDALDAAIRDGGITRPDARLRMRARELFACALETPGGLKVQTIHALCTRLLQQFPFEANVPARFQVLDDRDQNEMMERANLAVLLEAARDPESPAGRALNIAMASAADVTFKDVVREACLSRDHFMAWTDAAGHADAAAAQMSAALGRQCRRPHRGRRARDRRWTESAAIAMGGDRRRARHRQPSPIRTRRRGCARRCCSAARPKWMSISACSSPTSGTPRKSVVTKKFCDNNPAIAGLFDAESACASAR